MKEKIGVGLIGFGTVGTGVAKILLGSSALIKRRVGVPSSSSAWPTSTRPAIAA